MNEKLETSNPQRARRRPGQRMTKAERDVAQETFLKTLSNTANMRVACVKAGIHPSLVYQWQEHSTEFGIRFQQANKDANDMLFGEAWSRAMYGGEEIIEEAGVVTKIIRRKSDRLLELLLKARLPEFREKGSTIVNVLPKEYLFDANQDGVERE